MPPKKMLLSKDFADIEDRRVVLYHVDRDTLRGYGVARIDRFPTDLIGSRFDSDAFPTPCEYSGSGWSIAQFE